MVTANGTSLYRSLVYRVYREAMPILFFTVLAELFAGAMLLTFDVHFASMLGLFVLIPGLMQLRGNISTSLAQRLGSGTHLGMISWKQGLNEPLRANIKVAFFLVIIMSFLLAIGAFSVSMITQSLVPRSGRLLDLRHFLIISIGTALLASAFQVTITVTVALLAHARGLDPDNITIPVVAAIGDIITIVCLLIAITFAITLIPPLLV